MINTHIHECDIIYVICICNMYIKYVILYVLHILLPVGCGGRTTMSSSSDSDRNSNNKTSGSRSPRIAALRNIPFRHSFLTWTNSSYVGPLEGDPVVQIVGQLLGHWLLGCSFLFFGTATCLHGQQPATATVTPRKMDPISVLWRKGRSGTMSQWILEGAFCWLTWGQNAPKHLQDSSSSTVFLIFCMLSWKSHS